MTPRSWCRPTAARPADARQPQLLQSGAPPNWHGVILVVRSAEIVVVVRAKRQSSGDAGGSVYACSDLLVHPQLRVAEPQRHEVGDHALAVDRPQPLGGHLARPAACTGSSRSAFASGCADQNWRNSSRYPGRSDLLPRHRAMHGDLVAGDVLEDAVVGGRRPPGVVLGLQAVDRHDDRAAAGGRASAIGISRTALVTSCDVDAAGGQDRQQRRRVRGNGPAARRRRSTGATGDGDPRAPARRR